MALMDLLARRRQEIEEQLRSLRAELTEIKIAEDALAGRPQGVAPAGRTTTLVREGSIKDWIIRVLRDAPDGLETDDVIAAVSRAGGPPVSRSSMTPQLSRLKKAKLVTQEGRNWKITASSSSTLRDLVGQTGNAFQQALQAHAARGGVVEREPTIDDLLSDGEPSPPDRTRWLMPK